MWLLLIRSIELFAIRDGIEFLQSLQVTAAVLHSDCLLTVIVITSVGEDLFFLGNLIVDIKDLLKTSHDISIHHASRALLTMLLIG